MVPQTNQELFDVVAAHLSKGVQAIDEGGSCCYRTPDGRKCAIGCLIPDERYDPSMEGKVISLTNPVWAATGMDSKLFTLARMLQNTHDNSSPLTWRSRLEDIAADYKLNTDRLWAESLDWELA